jgi:ATP-binding cassette, subfamily B, multidrug efflux pump
MSQSAGKAWDFKLFRRIFGYSIPYMRLVVFALFTTLLLSVLGPLRPYFIGRMIEDYIAVKDADGLLFMTMIVLILLVVETFIQFYDAYITNVLGQSVIKDLRVQLFAHITRLRLKYFDSNPIGLLVTRAVSDMETIAQVFTDGFISITGDILKLFVVLGFMFYTNWQLTLVVIIPIPLLVVATNIFKRSIKKSFQEVRTQVGALNTFVQERITGMALVKVFNREAIEAEQFAEINKKHKKANIDSIKAYSIFFPVVEILSALSFALLVLFTTYQLSSGGAEFAALAGEMGAFILYINMMYRPIRMLADRFNSLQMGMVGCERVFKVLDTDEVIVNTGDFAPENIKGDIVFQNVSFAYNEPNFVLNDISLVIKSGDTVAFVGPTGAGKSSIINLLGRFYEYQQGTIAIDGVDLRKYEMNCLRKHIAVVLQEVFLYSDTIHNNITLGNDAISRDEVIAAAKAVGAHDFIMELPGGYDFNVKERGGLLSVGQRQLLAFIRAYVYNPDILILDEATSSIDSESERLIQQAIEQLTKGRTSIVIAHRLSTIRTANKIVVIDAGRIVQSGTHDELSKQEGMYKTLYEHQIME